MKATLHKAADRGHADHGWLKTHHSFSFASYHNPAKVHFGKLRVLNDDEIAAGMGFGTHPHDNMEIITIPLEGILAHTDSLGHEEFLRAGEVQVMSAGSGLKHAEYNASDSEAVKLLQIWIFPDERDVDPRYDQQVIKYSDSGWNTLVHPKGEGDGLWMHQQSWISRIQLHPGQIVPYEIKVEGNGVYFFNLSGKVDIGEQVIHYRDAVGLEGIKAIPVHAIEAVDLIAIEVPMR